MRPVRDWFLLLAGSAALTAALLAGTVPAAILIGPLLCAILLGVAGSRIRLPRSGFVAAQGVLACLVAHSVTPAFLAELARDGPAMALAVAATLVVSTVVGLLVARYGSLPGSTVAWGSAPGAASTMVALSEAHGADPRLVAFMQYLRVICVIACAAVVSRILSAPADAVPLAAAIRPAETAGLGSLAVTLAVALLGSAAGRATGVAAGGFIVPLVIGSVLNASGLAAIAPPVPLVGAACCAVGWYVGLQFERGTLRRSIRAVPEIVLASLTITALCGLSAWLLTVLTGADALTAFLATTPGGLETVAVIALDGGADAGFVMALQTLRLLSVLAIGPAIARLIARSAASRG